MWGYSSAGRAPALQAGGQRFDPDEVHHLLTIEKERRQRKLYMTLNLDSSICSDKCLNLTSSQNRTLKTEQSNQSMKSKQQGLSTAKCCGTKKNGESRSGKGNKQF